MVVVGSLLLLMVAPEAPVALFEEATFPAAWVQTPPESIRRALGAQGIAVETLDAAAVADPARLSATRVGVLVAPYGARYPAEAWPALQAFLRGGGKLLALGGYCFREPVERAEGGWREQNPRVEAARRPEALARRNALPALRELTLPPTPGLTSEWSPAGEGLPTRLRITTAPPAGAGVSLPLTLDPAQSYALYVRGRGIDVTAPGFGFAAIYEYAADGAILQWFDATQYRGAGEWQETIRPFRPHPDAARRELHLGTYLGSGSYEISHLVLATWPEKTLMTTADGEPRDGLVCRPEQLGMFDADFPLRRAVGLRPSAPAPGPTLPPGAPLAGWGATGITGGDAARWVPVLEATDAYGRPAGPAMSLLCHYGGHYAGSMWAYCGLEGDLGALVGEERLGALLGWTLGFLGRGLFLEAPRLAPDVALPGEALTLPVRVHNASDESRTVRVTSEGLGPTEARDLVVPPKGAAEVSFPGIAAAEVGLHRVAVTLTEGDRAVDGAETGYVVAPVGAAGEGPRLTWAENGFRVDGTPKVLFGSDTGANVFWSPAEGPRGWAEDLALCRDFGLDVYENLQFAWRPGGYNEVELRWVDGITQLAGERGRLYMAGWLIGADTWVTPEMQNDEAGFLTRVAQRYRETPWLFHYINGDLRGTLDADDGMVERFRTGALARYGSEEALREAWAPTPPETPFTDRWEAAWSCGFTRDAAEFGIGETRRWVTRHAEALRAGGATQPITAEYYQLPLGGVDLPETVDALDSANIGFFGHVPGRDLLDLTRALCFADSRIRGKGLALGEFGVKTHPAWGSPLEPASYHTQRGLEQQRSLFVGLVHIGLGMGASKFQNWCLRDFDEYCFPWGLFYPNSKQPRPVAYTYRSLTMLGHHVTPRWESPRVVVLLPDFHRTGAGATRAYNATLAAFDTLLRAHVPFQTLPDTRLTELPASAEVVWWPVPFCCSEEARASLEGFVARGGRLYLSGDLSWDAARRRTRLAEFERLVGARVTEAGPDPDGLAARSPVGSTLGAWTPVHGLEPVGSEVLAAYGDGSPLLLLHRLGEGRVVYANTAGELLAGADRLAPLYARALEALAVPRLPLEDPRVYAYEGPTHEGGRYLVLANLSRDEVEVDLTLDGRRVEATLAPEAPLLVAWDAAGRWSALSVTGRVALEGGVALEAPGGACALRAPGGAYAVAVGPYGAGQVSLRDPALEAASWELGEVVGGVWEAYESPGGGGAGAATLELTEDRATLVALLAEPGAHGAARELAAR